MASGTLEDRIMIRELLEQYADAVTQRDAKLWGDTWAKDSEWNLPVVPGMEEIKGRDNIVAAWTEAMKIFPFVFMEAIPGHLRFEGDVCYARSYTSEVAVLQDGQEIRPRGQYDDVIVKENGRWLFKKRAFNPLHGE